jgi:hypothetical protein
MGLAAGELAALDTAPDELASLAAPLLATDDASALLFALATERAEAGELSELLASHHTSSPAGGGGTTPRRDGGGGIALSEEEDVDAAGAAGAAAGYCTTAIASESPTQPHVTLTDPVTASGGAT